MRANSKQILSIALLPFVLAASVASLDALVLCTADGHGTAVEVAHPARTVCGSRLSSSSGASGCCRHSGGLEDQIKHDHGICRDVPLRLNQGDVKDRRPVVGIQAESLIVENMERVISESTVRLPGHRSLLQHLKSVVLLV